MSESKSLTPISVELKADTPGAIRVAFATLNVVDHDGDVTLPGAFGRQDVRIQPHGHDTSGWSIGKGTIHEEGGRAVLDGRLNLDSEGGREAYAALKFDMEHGSPLQEWSYVFNVRDSERGEFDGQRVRFLKQIEVFSVDPVFKGAGVGTRTLAVKSTTAADLASAVADAELAVAVNRYRDIKQSLKPLTVEVDEAEVSPETRSVGRWALEEACRSLSVAVPSLRWFRPATADERKAHEAGEPVRMTPWRMEKRAAGLAETDQATVWLDAALGPWEAAGVAAHEVKHFSLATYKHNLSREAEEDNCDDYARVFVRGKAAVIRHMLGETPPPHRQQSTEKLCRLCLAGRKFTKATQDSRAYGPLCARCYQGETGRLVVA